MRKKDITRKLIMSISTAAMTAACLVTSTYAWFTRNEVVWTEETDFNLDFYSGLLISFDGVNYHQDVTKEELYQAITGLEGDEAEAAFKNIKFDGVTPEHENELVTYNTSNKINFLYDTVDKETKEHASAPATPNEKYIQFDLYFRIADGGTVTSTNVPKYKLKFTNLKDENDQVVKETYVKSKSGVQTVKIVNSLTTMEKTYSAGEEINVDGANALRVGVETYDNQGINPDSFEVYEPVNEYNLGSAAIEGRTDDLHDPSKNAMYTYYNNFFSEKFTKAADDGEAFNTHDKFLDDTNLGTFEGVVGTDPNGNQIYKYNDVKITMYLWLEGWDADYFYGITSSNELARTMQSSFVFTYEEI